MLYTRYSPASSPPYYLDLYVHAEMKTEYSNDFTAFLTSGKTCSFHSKCNYH